MSNNTRFTTEDIANIEMFKQGVADRFAAHGVPQAAADVLYIAATEGKVASKEAVLGAPSEVKVAQAAVRASRARRARG